MWIEAISEYIFIHLNFKGLAWKYPKRLIKLGSDFIMIMIELHTRLLTFPTFL